MVESGRSLGISSKDTGLKVPDNGLIVPKRRIIKANELPDIFGKDVRLLTQNQLIEWGILPKGSNLEFYHEPEIHRYTIVGEDGKPKIIESHAQYFVDTIIGDHGILASLLPPDSESSEHMHLIEEIYKRIAGKTRVRRGDQEFVLDGETESLKIPVKTEHQVLTDDDYAFILIVMRNAGPIPRDQWHEPTNRFGRKS